MKKMILLFAIVAVATAGLTSVYAGDCCGKTKKKEEKKEEKS